MSTAAETWTAANERAMKLQVKHILASSVMYDRAASHVGWWSTVLSALTILLPAVLTVLGTVLAASCATDKCSTSGTSSFPEWCTAVSWINVVVGAGATAIGAWLGWWQPAQKAEKYDQTSQDLQYEAGFIDSKLGLPRARRPDHIVMDLEMRGRYDRIVGRGGRMPGICFKGGSMPVSPDEMRQLPNYSCLESFMDIKANASTEILPTVRPSSTVSEPLPRITPIDLPDPSEQPVAHSLPKTITPPTILTAADEILLKRLADQMERYDKLLEQKKRYD